MRELIYKGVSYDQQGRRAYLNARRRDGPSEAQLYVCLACMAPAAVLSHSASANMRSHRIGNFEAKITLVRVGNRAIQLLMVQREG